jgi:hypothetical protein
MNLPRTEHAGTRTITTCSLGIPECRTEGARYGRLCPAWIGRDGQGLEVEEVA